MSDKIELIRGDDQILTFTFTDGDNAVVNLTGSIVFFTAKINKSDLDDDAVIAVSQDFHINPTGGVTKIEIANTDTEDLEPGDYFWDTQVKFPDGEIKSTMSDVLTIVPDVTRRISA